MCVAQGYQTHANGGPHCEVTERTFMFTRSEAAVCKYTGGTIKGVINKRFYALFQDTLFDPKDDALADLKYRYGPPLLPAPVPNVAGSYNAVNNNHAGWLAYSTLSGTNLHLLYGLPNVVGTFSALIEAVDPHGIAGQCQIPIVIDPNVPPKIDLAA